MTAEEIIKLLIRAGICYEMPDGGASVGLQDQVDIRPFLEKVMSKHDGLPVSGYNPQSPENVARVNVNKELEERSLRAVEACRDNGADPRMIALAITQIQQGFMWANRAVFQPSRVKLPEDN